MPSQIDIQEEQCEGALLVAPPALDPMQIAVIGCGAMGCV